MLDIEGVKASGFRLLVLTPTGEVLQGAEDSLETQSAPAAHSDVRTLFSYFLNGLTGSAPSQDLTTFAGYTSHPPLQLRNKYYSADVNLWCDELPPPTVSTRRSENPGLAEWTEQMLSDEAKEAREVIGGIVLVVSHVQTTDAASTTQQLEAQAYIKYIEAVNELRDMVEDESGRDIATVVVVQDMTPRATSRRRAQARDATDIASFAETLDDMCVSDLGIFGWDVVAWQPEIDPSSTNPIEAEISRNERQDIQAQKLRNEYGEKTGMARVTEILEQTNWSASPDNISADEGYGLLSTEDFMDSDDGFTAPGFKPKFNPHSHSHKDVVGQQSDEFQREILGLHFALEEQSQQQTDEYHESGNDLSVEQLTGLMSRVVATREAAAEMSRDEREKFARREVSKIMREMNMDGPS